MGAIGKLAAVVVLGVVDFWLAVPLGIGFGLPAFLVAVIVAVSASVGVVLAVAFGGRLRAWWARRRAARSEAPDPRQPSRQTRRAERILERFGAVGLGLIGPLLLGSSVSAAVGASLGVPERRLTIWAIVGAVGWTLVSTVAVATGVELFFR